MAVERKWYEFSRNHTLDSERGSSPGPAMCVDTVLSAMLGRAAAAPGSHAIGRVGDAPFRHFAHSIS